MKTFTHRDFLRILAVSAVLHGVSAPSLKADDSGFTSNLAGSASASWSLGGMSNTDKGLPSRTMDAFSLEAFPQYRFNEWFVGPNFDYAWVNQLTSVADAGGTNLKGHHYLLGLGVKRTLGQCFAVQGVFDFLGRYTFSNQTATSEDNHLSGTLGARLKGQYFFSDLPVSADVNFQYTRWGTMTVTSKDFSAPTHLWLAGIGVTYHIGAFRGVHESEKAPVPAPVLPAPQSVPTPAVSEAELRQKAEEQALAKIAEVKRTDRGLMMNLQGDMSFPPNSVKLTPQAQDIVAKTAEILAKNPGRKVRVEGYTDSSGNKAKNLKLSQARAANVKAALIQHGVKAENVSAQGMGQEKPLVSNETAEGRAKNRRVEIYIQEN